MSRQSVQTVHFALYQIQTLSSQNILSLFFYSIYSSKTFLHALKNKWNFLLSSRIFSSYFSMQFYSFLFTLLRQIIRREYLCPVFYTEFSFNIKKECNSIRYIWFQVFFTCIFAGRNMQRKLYKIHSLMKVKYALEMAKKTVQLPCKMLRIVWCNFECCQNHQNSIIFW